MDIVRNGCECMHGPRRVQELGGFLTAVAHSRWDSGRTRIRSKIKRSQLSQNPWISCFNSPGMCFSVDLTVPSSEEWSENHELSETRLGFIDHFHLRSPACYISNKHYFSLWSSFFSSLFSICLYLNENPTEFRETDSQDRMGNSSVPGRIWMCIAISFQLLTPLGTMFLMNNFPFETRSTILIRILIHKTATLMFSKSWRWLFVVMPWVTECTEIIPSRSCGPH
jgi:hypothetical protein